MISVIRRKDWDALTFAAAALVVIAFLAGGASRDHALRLALVELTALPVLVLALRQLLASGQIARHKLALGLLAATACLPLVQLIPLPPQLWSSLPGRQELSLALELSGTEPGWSPLSLTPDRTWRSFLALVPPAAMFVAALSFTTSVKRDFVLLLMVLATMSVLLGVVQLASGDTRFYPWATTDAGNMSGLFANRNHLATLLLIAIPFAAVLGGASYRHHRDPRKSKVWLSALFIGLAIVALGVVRSRAGIILAAPSLILGLLVAWFASGRTRPSLVFLSLGGVIAAAIAAVAVFALPPILDRFDPNGQTEGRFENWPIVAEAAQSYLPAGSGLGSFDAVYRSVEPLEQLDATFFNQAHNEYLEVWLETGWSGAALLLIFFVWFGRRIRSAWQTPSSTETDLQRAASVALFLMLLHSLGDYPLRTETLAVVFALCASLLTFAGSDQGRSERHAVS